MRTRPGSSRDVNCPLPRSPAGALCGMWGGKKLKERVIDDDGHDGGDGDD